MSRTLDRSQGDYDKMPSVAGDAVVENGSNSDGEWTRWADGTQTCHDSKVAGTRSFAVSFTGQPSITATAVATGPKIVAAVDDITSSDFELVTYDTDPSAIRTGHTTYYFAVGRWK